MELTHKQFYLEMYDIKTLVSFYGYCLYFYKSVNFFSQLLVFVISLIGLGNIGVQFFGSNSAIILSYLQILSIVSSYYFSFNTHIINLSIAIEQLDELYYKMSSDWFKIANSKLDNEEVNELWTKYKMQKFNIKLEDYKILELFFIKRANKKADGYLLKYFCGVSNDNEQ